MKILNSVSIALFVLSLALPIYGAEKRVFISRGDLSPETIEIAQGDEVIWVNTAGVPIHMEFDTQPGGHLFQLPKDAEARVRFQQPGEHKYVVHVAETTGGGTWGLRGAIVVK